MPQTAPSSFITEHLQQSGERRAHIKQLQDGSFIVKGRLTPEQGALLKKALESGMDEAFEEQKDVPAETPIS